MKLILERERTETLNTCHCSLCRRCGLHSTASVTITNHHWRRIQLIPHCFIEHAYLAAALKNQSFGAYSLINCSFLRVQFLQPYNGNLASDLS